MRTRNIVWHAPLSFTAARKIAKRVLREDKRFRKAKRSCPCGFDHLLVANVNIWCVSCGLMVPANSVYSIKTGRRVRF